MGKMEFITSYIRKCDEVIRSESTTDAYKLQNEIIGVFESEISDIRNMLDRFNLLAMDSNYQVDYIGDIKILRQKLKNYSFNYQQKQDKMKHEIELARLKQPQLTAHAASNSTQTSTQTTTQTSQFNITFEQTLKQLDEISEEKLSATDKKALKDLLISLEDYRSPKEANNFWSKAIEVLKFLAEKGVDAAIAILPYIMAGLQGMNK